MANEKQTPNEWQIGGERYLETRLNLLTLAIDKLEAALRERIDAVEETILVGRSALMSEITHTKQMLETAQHTANRSNDKAEKTQHDINVAGNEWRGTLNDFKSTVPTKDELNRIYAEFQAHKLEMSKIIAAQVGEKSGSRETKTDNKETKDDSKSMIALAVSVASALILVYSLFKPSAPPAAIPAPQVIYVPAPAGALIPSAPTQPQR